MEVRDAIVSWLEQGDNFLRVTASSSFSSSTRRGGANMRDVAQAESQALNELASFVNQSIPHTNWDAKHAAHMLKHYLMEYRSTAANLQVSSDEKDELNAKQLHEPVEDQENQQSNGQRETQQTTYVKLHCNLTDVQRSEREKEVVPESDLSNWCENSETDKKDEAALQLKEKEKTQSIGMMEAPVEEKAADKEAEVVTSVEKEKEQEETSKKEQNDEKSNRVENKSGATLTTKKGKREKRAKAAKTTQKKKKNKAGPKSKKQPPKRNNLTPAPQLLALTSEEEEEDEELPVLRRSSSAKRRAARSSKTSDRRGEDDPPWIKRKLRRLESVSEQTGRVDVSDVTPTQTTQAASSSASDDPQGSPMNDENTPTGNSRSHDKQLSGNKRKAVRKVPQGATVPDTLRSAIAQVVSHRQQLLSRSQAHPSESDYGLSDIDLPSVGVPHNGQRSSDIRRSIRHEPGPSVGLLPPLIDMPLTVSGRSNLKRKRVFFHAKELAFEQLKWQHENEFQQHELELLRREMEVREALAQQELKLKRMRIRADVIQPMISAGASIADIAERLRLLGAC